MPREELSQILKLLKPRLSETCVLVVNTPIFKFDNDVIKRWSD